MRFSCLALFICAAPLFAQDLSTPGLKRMPPKEFDQMLRKGLQQNRAVQVLQLVADNKECAIPLLEYRVKHPEQYTIRRLPVPAQGDPIAHPAMPVCKR